MSGKGFFSRILGGGGDDETSVFSPEALGRKESRRGRGGPPPPEEEQRAQGFTVERAAEIIDDLPPEVPRDSAVRIVRGTLMAAGIQVEDLETEQKRLSGRGVALAPPVDNPNEGYREVRLHDPEGTPIRLFCRILTKTTPEAAARAAPLDPWRP